MDYNHSFLHLLQELQRKHNLLKATANTVARNMILGARRSKEFDDVRHHTTLPFSREQLQAAGILC